MTAGASLCLILLGLFCFGYDGLIAPLLAGGAAAREYDEKEELRMATTLVFEGIGSGWKTAAFRAVCL